MCAFENFELIERLILHDFSFLLFLNVGQLQRFKTFCEEILALICPKLCLKIIYHVFVTNVLHHKHFNIGYSVLFCVNGILFKCYDEIIKRHIIDY